MSGVLIDKGAMDTVAYKDDDHMMIKIHREEAM